MALSTRDHVKPALNRLHWLPVKQRISYKLCLLMHYIRTGQAAQYLSNCVSTISSSGTGIDSDRVTRLTTYCREHAPSLANVVSTTPVQPPGTLCHLTYMTLLTLTYLRNDLKLFCLIVRTDLLLLLYGAPPWTVRRAAPYKSLIVFVFVFVLAPSRPISRWLSDSAKEAQRVRRSLERRWKAKGNNNDYTWPTAEHVVPPTKKSSMQDAISTRSRSLRRQKIHVDDGRSYAAYFIWQRARLSRVLRSARI